MFKSLKPHLTTWQYRAYKNIEILAALNELSYHAKLLRRHISNFQK